MLTEDPHESLFRNARGSNLCSKEVVKEDPVVAFHMYCNARCISKRLKHGVCHKGNCFCQY